MTIYFYPSLPSGTLYFDWQSIKGFDTKVMNTLQFVEWLEFQNGVHHETPEPGRKLAKYMTGMNQCQGTVYKDSYKIDPIGVARACMEWTEALRMVGWNGGMRTGCARIDDLGKFQWNDPDSIAGRIETLMAMKPKVDASIVLPCEKKYLQPILQHLFDSIEGCSIEVLEPASTPEGCNLEKFKKLVDEGKKAVFSAEDKSLEVWQFKDSVDAMSYLSAYNGETFEAWINSDNTIFDEWLKISGKAQGGSIAKDVTPLRQQIFPLGMRLFSHPEDVDNLLGYLSVKGHPLKGIAFLLRKKLLANGGVFEWKKAVDEYLSKHPDCGITSDMCNRLLPVYDFDKGCFCKPNLDVTSIRAFCSEMSEFSGEFAELDAILDGRDGSLEDIELDELVMSLTRSADVMQSQAQVGAPTVINSPGSIVGRSAKTIWVDFSHYDTHRLSTEFLSVGEKKSLTDAGCFLWDGASEAHFLKAMDSLPLYLTSEKLVLVLTERKARGDEATNPLQILLSGSEGYENIVKHPDLDMLVAGGIATTEAVSIENKREDDVDGCLTFRIPCVESDDEQCVKFKGLLKREVESPSSIESLIQNPFEYYMHYVLGFPGEEGEQLPKTYLVTGNVAHLVLQDIFFSKKITTQVDLDKEFEDSYRNGLWQKGLEMLKADNAMMELVFHDNLKESAGKLLEIIDALELEVEDVEHHGSDNKNVLAGDVEIAGYIDMLLHEKKCRTNKVILDFKWTSRPETYTGKIKEGKSVQLSLYRKMVSLEKDSTVVGTAYFLMPCNELHTNDRYFSKYPESNIIPMSDAGICEKIRNSVQYRKEQFLNGKIELGEKMKGRTLNGPDIAVLEYISDTLGRNLLPLDIVGSRVVRKEAFGFTGYGSFKFD